MTKPTLILIPLLILTSCRSQSNRTPSGEIAEAGMIGGLSSSAPTCASVSDGLCAKIWDPKSPTTGNTAVSDGKILMGTTDDEIMSMSRFEDVTALVNSAANLPPDLKAALGPLLTELKGLLDTRVDTKAWYEKFSDIFARINRAVTETAEARFRKDHPTLADKPNKDKTPEESTLDGPYYEQVDNEILEAKYAKHPNWQRVEEVYAQVRQDLIAEVNELPISTAAKKERIDILKTVELTLPYTDGVRLDADGSCGSSEVNATYHSDYNKFTVCAGLFNQFQSKKALYTVIAHELSHSIDPQFFASRVELAGPANKLTQKLIGAKGPVYSCAEWTSIRAQLPSMPKIELPKFDPLNKLADCLAPKEDLEPFDPARIQQIIAASVRSQVSSEAGAHLFLLLTQPTTNKDGASVPNPYYMRPDLLVLKNQGFDATQPESLSANDLEIYTQAFACQDPALPETDRMRNSIKELAQFKSVRLASIFSACGQNCEALSNYGMARSPSENFADWLAARALNRAVLRETTVTGKRDVMALGFPLFCRRPDVSTEAPELALVEKEFSLEPHNDARLRRLSLFNDENAAQAQCQVTDEEKGFGKCEP